MPQFGLALPQFRFGFGLHIFSDGWRRGFIPFDHTVEFLDYSTLISPALFCVAVLCSLLIIMDLCVEKCTVGIMYVWKVIQVVVWSEGIHFSN